MKPIQQWTSADIIELTKKVDKPTWIKIGAGAFVGVILIIFVVLPAWFERPGVRSKVKSLKSQIATTNALFKKKPELLKNKEEFQKLIQGSKDRLYQPGESSLLLGVISKMAEESHVSVVSSRPKPASAAFPAPFNDRYEASSYDFTVEGGYHDLAAFVSRIESNAKLLRVEVFKIQPRDETPNVHQADISLTAVTLKKPKEAAA